MNGPAYQFTFPSGVPMGAVEDTLMLAALAAESLYGRARLRTEARFELSRRRRLCLISADNEVSRAVGRIFTGFINRQFGERAYRFEQIAADAAPPQGKRGRAKP